MLWSARDYTRAGREVRERSWLFGLVRYRVTEGEGLGFLPPAFLIALIKCSILFGWATPSEAGLGTWGLMFLIMGIVFMLGFFLDWLEITLIILPIFAPMVATFDFGDHVDKREALYWFTVLLAINLQTSFLTPPFGYALFYLKGIAPPEVTLLSIYRGIIPFVILQLIGLAMVLTFPEIALWPPRSVYGD